jgi:hypothetical protein
MAEPVDDPQADRVGQLPQEDNARILHRHFRVA